MPAFTSRFQSATAAVIRLSGATPSAFFLVLEASTVASKLALDPLPSAAFKIPFPFGCERGTASHPTSAFLSPAFLFDAKVEVYIDLPVFCRSK